MCIRDSSWGLFRDAAHVGRYIEYFVDENWVEHQRRLIRFSASDAALRSRRLALHLGPEPPVLRRYVAESLEPDDAAPRSPPQEVSPAAPPPA